jgi:hypothetical protein
MDIHELLAYIDPGSGMILLQLIIAGAIGVVVFCRNLLWRAFCFVTGRPPRPEDKEADEPQQVSKDSLAEKKDSN